MRWRKANQASIGFFNLPLSLYLCEPAPSLLFPNYFCTGHWIGVVNACGFLLVSKDGATNEGLLKLLKLTTDRLN
jgi:hypothetical protein